MECSQRMCHRPLLKGKVAVPGYTIMLNYCRFTTLYTQILPLKPKSQSNVGLNNSSMQRLNKFVYKSVAVRVVLGLGNSHMFGASRICQNESHLTRSDNIVYTANMLRMSKVIIR